MTCSPVIMVLIGLLLLFCIVVAWMICFAKPDESYPD